VEGCRMPAFNPPPLLPPRNQEKPRFNCTALLKVITVTTTTIGNVNMRQKNQI